MSIYNHYYVGISGTAIETYHPQSGISTSMRYQHAIRYLLACLVETFVQRIACGWRRWPPAAAMLRSHHHRWQCEMRNRRALQCRNPSPLALGTFVAGFLDLAGKPIYPSEARYCRKSCRLDIGLGLWFIWAGNFGAQLSPPREVAVSGPDQLGQTLSVLALLYINNLCRLHCDIIIQK